MAKEEQESEQPLLSFVQACAAYGISDEESTPELEDEEDSDSGESELSEELGLN